MVKGRKPRVPAAPVAERCYLSNGEVEELCLSANTKKTYNSHLSSHAARGYELNVKGIEQHLRCLDVPGKLSGLIDAYDYHRRKAGKKRLRLETRERLLRICRARELRTSGQMKTRGAIDETKLDQLLADIRNSRSKHAAQDAENILLCWATGYRQADMKELKVGSIRRNLTGEGSPWQVDYVVHKDPKRIDKKGVEHRILDVHRRGFALVERLRRGIGPGANGAVPAAPGWCTTRLNRYIKATAERHQWDPRLEWVGVHGLRHGVITTVYQESGEDAARAVSGHAPSSRCLERYRRTNAERMAIVKRARRDGVPPAAVVGSRSRHHLNKGEVKRRKSRREEEHHHEQRKKGKKQTHAETSFFPKGFFLEV
jgi:hypothetical protein